MEQHNGLSLKSADPVPAAELASVLCAAQERALEQRLAVEELLAEARSLEERLAVEALQARAAAERALAQKHAADAVTAAVFESEAIVQVETCAWNLAEVTRQHNALNDAADGAHAEYAAAAAAVAECEQRLNDARAALASAEQTYHQADAQRADLAAVHAAAEADAATAAQQLAGHRAARQRAEAASSEAEQRARALHAPDMADYVPSLEPVEELRLLETRIALRAEAAKRAAERRASDAARNHVAH